MNPVTNIQGTVAPLLIENIDTDVIIPQTELVTIKKSGLGKGLFARWRYDQNRQDNPEFILNQDKFRSASVLLTDKNFGCGSSREHAVWALMDFGIECVIATSFGEIFYHNALKNGLLVALISSNDFELLKIQISHEPQQASITIADQKIKVGNLEIGFELSEHYKNNLLQGLDEIDETLMLQKRIVAFQAQDKVNRPWVYNHV
jgi:3-isopropylmalate/(R)-2-methylmalate dehydratase small subunit